MDVKWCVTPDLGTRGPRFIRLGRISIRIYPEAQRRRRETAQRRDAASQICPSYPLTTSTFLPLSFAHYSYSVPLEMTPAESLLDSGSLEWRHLAEAIRSTFPSGLKFGTNRASSSDFIPATIEPHPLAQYQVSDDWEKV